MATEIKVQLSNLDKNKAHFKGMVLETVPSPTYNDKDKTVDILTATVSINKKLWEDSGRPTEVTIRMDY